MKGGVTSWLLRSVGFGAMSAMDLSGAPLNQENDATKRPFLNRGQ